jgi:hypothetical protein
MNPSTLVAAPCLALSLAVAGSARAQLPPGGVVPPMGSERTAGPRRGEPTGPAVVRVHVDSPVPVELRRDRGVRDTVYGGTSVTWVQTWERLCVTPCDREVDAPRGSSFSIVPADENRSFPEPLPFALHGHGKDLLLTVRPGSDGGLYGGRVLTVLGALGTFFGGLGVVLAYTGMSDEGPGFRAASVGMLLGGTAALGGGIPLLLLSRTRVSVQPRAAGLALSVPLGG